MSQAQEFLNNVETIYRPSCNSDCDYLTRIVSWTGAAKEYKLKITFNDGSKAEVVRFMSLGGTAVESAYLADDMF